jgi:hypothetical protein
VVRQGGSADGGRGGRHERRCGIVVRMTIPMVDVATAVTRYADRFHRACGSGHHIASPLGAWLLLALCASASTGRTREELAEVLGMDAGTAATVAQDLLDEPHPLVASAAAVWNRPIGDVAALEAWTAGLSPRVRRGDLPTQEDLDYWARLHTQGLIDRFPIEISADTVVVLATVLATKVSWELPFDVAPAAELGPSPWAGQLSQVLRTPDHWGHRQFIATTETASDVAVHTAQAQHRPDEEDYQPLLVTSVIAASDVPPATVLAEAHRIAIATAFNDPVPRRSLYDLPLGESPLWTITEGPATTNAPDGRDENCIAILPAWTARSELDLTRADVGMLPAAQAVAQLLGLAAFRFEAKQSAVATYDRTGFEAAAVTAMDIALGFAAPPQPGLRRTGILRFGHPYAVVAVTNHHRRMQRYDEPITAPWHGLPVFSAWITDPAPA